MIGFMLELNVLNKSTLLNHVQYKVLNVNINKSKVSWLKAIVVTDEISSTRDNQQGTTTEIENENGNSRHIHTIIFKKNMKNLQE